MVMPVRELLTFWKKNCDWGRYNMGKYFGTGGFRGEAGITLTADHTYKVGRFLGWYYNALRERNDDTDLARIVVFCQALFLKKSIRIPCF